MRMTYNYYQILGCSEKASLEEIKKKYRELILASHPDKCSNDKKTTEDFDILNEAWHMLRDANKRKVYDAQLKQETLAQEALLFERLSVTELSYDTNSETYSYNCRCGGEYRVDAQELFQLNSSLECSLECNTCSLLINVYYVNSD